jgi:hypothetical protein
MNPPVVAIVDVPHRRSDAALSHYGVCLAEERFRNNRDLCAGGGGLDRGSQPGASRSNNHHIMLMRDVLGH